MRSVPPIGTLTPRGGHRGIITVDFIKDVDFTAVLFRLQETVCCLHYLNLIYIIANPQAPQDEQYYVLETGTADRSTPLPYFGFIFEFQKQNSANFAEFCFSYPKTVTEF